MTKDEKKTTPPSIRTIHKVPGQEIEQSGQRPTKQQLPKSPGLAVVLSIFIPGVGNMYAGKPGKGIAFLAGAILSCVLMVVLIGFIMYGVVWVFGMTSAYNDTVMWNWQHGFRRFTSPE